jgi:ribonucleotide reductase alpha subunit
MSEDDEMYVTKRNGERENVAFDKILRRIKTIGTEVDIKINYSSLAMKVIDQLYSGISTTKIDELSAEQCASLASTHQDYNILAGRIIVSNHHKNTKESFYEVMKDLYNNSDIHSKHCPVVTKEMFDLVEKHREALENSIVFDRDYLIDYFGFKTLERAYLMKIKNKIVERPQHMWMRVSLGIHKDNIDRVLETYEFMSQKYFTHATPTLYNAGTPKPQLSSCYLLAMESDSIGGIYNTLKDCALISKWAGGIGLHIHNVRASGSQIRGTNGASNGIVPMLKVFNNTAKYVDQCVVPETKIYTTKGVIDIQDCEVGETEIFNVNGEEEVIKDVLEHDYDGELLTIKTLHSIFPLNITPMHPVYAIQNQTKGLNYQVIKNRLSKNITECEWVEAKDLDCNSMIGFSIPSYKKDVDTISEDDCYVYGLILGDGYISNNTDTSGYLSLHSESKKHVIEYMKIYLEKNNVDYHVNEVENTTRIRWNKCIHLPHRRQDIYNSNNEKRISSKWLNLPLYKVRQIVKGLLHTDGCIRNEIVFDSTSLNLIEGLRYLCLRMGLLTSGYVRDRVGEKHETKTGRVIENKKISYVLRIPKVKEICDLLDIVHDDKQFVKFFSYNNMLFTRVQEIETSSYKGVLYDLQMEKEHNYMIHNGLVHNGGGKRNGSFAIYLEPWHADIEIFLQMRKNHGDEELKARDLFYALWTPDLFMERVKADGKWTLMCPDECPGLSDVYGDEFKELYEKYENEERGKKTVNARDLWFQVLDAQMETGTPYLLYKDASNKKSNQQNLGTIKSSNLCSEIVEYSDETETAVCNLASISLTIFVKKDEEEKPYFDFEELHKIAKIVAYNLNQIIDVNFYPTEKTEKSNMRHRPIGIGVQGLADAFFKMNLAFTSDEAQQLNKDIFETIYHASVETSNEIAISRYNIVNEKRYKKTVVDTSVYEIFNDFEKEMWSLMDEKKTTIGSYSTFEGSPMSKGVFQFDMWNVTPSNRYDWEELKTSVMTYGIRNSLLMAPMPTASTSQILGNNECIEPITSNIYSRRTMAGEFILANKYLMKDLMDLELWNEKIKNNIIANNGSIQQLEMVPEDIREKYKTVWELPMRKLIDMAADRGAYICQSQSLNLWLEDPNYNNLTSMHFYSWSKGLKTGIYYLRRRARHQAQQFTIEPEKTRTDSLVGETEDEICEMCSG